MNATRLIIGIIISGVGFICAVFAAFMLLWGWSDSGERWGVIWWMVAILLWSPPFLISVWLVYRCVGSSLKRAALAELLGIMGVCLYFVTVVNFGRPPQTLLEQHTPLMETERYSKEAPALPLHFPAVGIEAPDGKFNPIMYLTTQDSGSGDKEILATIGPGVESPEIKIFRGTNDLADENHFLGEFEIVNYAKIKEPRQLWLFFFVDEKGRLFVQPRAVDQTHNDALKLKRVWK